MLKEPPLQVEDKPAVGIKPVAPWLTAGRFGILAALLVLVSFPGVLLRGKSFIIRDFGLFSYPAAYFHRQSFWHGEIPLWNPLNYCGVPFLAQWNTMALYPGSLIYLLLPMPWSLSFFCLAHLFWGGLGMYFLARDWTKHDLAAGLAGIIFSFNGLMLNFLMWPSHVATFSWLPWVLWLAPQGWRQGGKKMLWGILTASMQMLAGAPETIFLTWVTLLALAAGDWVRSKRWRPFAPEVHLTIAQRFSVGNLVEGQQSSAGTAEMVAPAHSAVPPGPGAISPTNPTLKRWAIFGQSLRDRSSDDPKGATMPERTVGEDTNGCSPNLNRKPLLGCQKWAILLRFFAMAILVFLICAPQLLPFLELLGHSQRSSGYGAASHDWSIPFWGWANFLVPLFRTSPTPQGVFLQNGQYWTSSYYAGIGTVFLALVALRRLGDWRMLTVAGLGLTALVLAWGDGTLLYRGLTFCFPEMGFVRYPVKFVILVLAVIPLVAAFGLKTLVSKGARLGRFEWICGAGMLVLIAAIVRVDWNAPIPRDVWTATLKSGLSRGGFLVLAFALISVFRWRQGLLTAPDAQIQPSLRDLQGAERPDPTLKRWAILRRPSGTFGERMGNFHGLIALFRNCLVRRPGLQLSPIWVYSCRPRALTRRSSLIGTALLSIFWLDLITQMPTQNPTVPGSVYRPGWASQQLHWNPRPAPGISRVMTSPTAHRVIDQTWLADPEKNYLRSRLAAEINCNVLDNAPHVDGFFSLVPRETFDIAGLLNPLPRKSERHESSAAPTDLTSLMDFLGVSEITAPGKLTNWVARPTFMPLVTVGQRVVFADDQSTLAALRKGGGDLRQIVYLPIAARSLVQETGASQAGVTNVEFSNNRVSFETVAVEPAIAVISQSTYPNWKAYVDGRAVKLWRANYAFQALQVSAGRHQVVLRYEDRAFLTGVGMSVVGIALWLGAWLRFRQHCFPAALTDSQPGYSKCSPH